MSVISQNVKRIALNKGVDCVDLAHATNTPLATMNKWWVGVRNPTAYGLYRISKALDCPMEDFMVGIEEDPGANGANNMQ